jgi:hypothetical protein
MLASEIQPLGSIPNCASPERLAIFRLGAFSGPHSPVFPIERLIMNLLTKLAITGLGVAVLMLLAFLMPVDAMVQIA